MRRWLLGALAVAVTVGLAVGHGRGASALETRGWETPTQNVPVQEARVGPDPRALVAEGNRRYQEEDFTGAIEAYRSVLDAGFESGDLYFNLGNAWFREGELGPAILAWERAARLLPSDPDVQANLELARSLTVDDVTPQETFWLLQLWDGWIHLLPRDLLLGVVGIAWLLTGSAVVARVLSREPQRRRLATRTALGSGGLFLLFGIGLLVRETGLGRPTVAIVLADQVTVQSAPVADADQTLFTVHEGLRVKVERRTEAWAEVTLEDGRVGWVPADAIEVVRTDPVSGPTGPG